MRRLIINGRTKRVFVLNETDKRIVYIPVDALHRVDYERLKTIDEKNPDNMLEEMKDTKLDNGRNALVVYDKLIQVANKATGVQMDKFPTTEKAERFRKMEELLEQGMSPEEAVIASTQKPKTSDFNMALEPETISMKSILKQEETVVDKPKRRGRPPKNAAA